MATATKQLTAEIGQPAAVNPWLIAIMVTLATFMELLDTAIANVSLPHIAGGLATSYVSGVIGRKTVELGQRIQPAQSLLAIVPLDGYLGDGRFQGNPAQVHAPRSIRQHPCGHVRS